jgi:hypothetical protein
MKTILVQCSPLKTDGTGQRAVVYAASSPSPEGYGVGGFDWRPAVTRRPAFSQELFDPDITGAVEAGSVSLTLDLAAMNLPADPQFLHWKDAPITIWSTEDLDWPSAEVEFTGYIETPTWDEARDSLQIRARVSTALLDKPLLYREFTGGGGALGDAEMRGTPMPAGFGPVPAAGIVWFDTTNNIGMLDGYSNLLVINRLLEGGAESLGDAVADYASYEALRDAITSKAIPPGRWGTSIANGLIGLGAPPAGVITADALFGDATLAGLLGTLAIERAGVSAALVDQAAFDAVEQQVEDLIGFTPTVGYWLSEQRQILDLMQRLCGSANASLIVRMDGKVSATRAASSAASSLNIDRSGGLNPRVSDWQPMEVLAPVWQMKARTARPGVTLTIDQILFEAELKDRGAYNAGTVYQLGDLVWMPDESQWLYTSSQPSAGNQPPDPPSSGNSFWSLSKPALNTQYVYFNDGTSLEDWRGLTDQQLQTLGNTVDRLGSDGWITGSEKRDLYIQYQQLNRTWLEMDQAAENSGIGSSERANASAAMAALRSYLDSLQPNWLDTSTDTPVDVATFKQKWDDAISAVAALQGVVVGETVGGGPSGRSNAAIPIYKRAATAGSLPSSAATYTFSTGSLTGLNNGWSATPPAFDGNPLWQSFATASASEPTDTIQPNEWSGAVQVVGNGTRAVPIFIYRRSASTPALPSATATYTFSSNTISGLNNSWSAVVPADNGLPLWVSTATAAGSVTDATDAIPAGEWDAPQIMAKNGIDGLPGSDGAKTYRALIYRRSVNAPPLPTQAATVYFENGSIVGLNNGWSSIVPGNDGNPLWVSAATAYGTGSSDTVPATEWASPVIYVENGDPGQNGFNAISIPIFRRSASTPALPSATATYTFSSKSLTGLNNSWSATPPANNGLPLWVSYATALSTTDSDQIGAGEWSSPQIQAQNGTTGDTGPQGPPNVTMQGIVNVATVSGTITKNSGADGAWNAMGRSVEAYTAGAQVSFRFNQSNRKMMVGLNADRDPAVGYDTIDYAWFANTDNNTIWISENGVFVENVFSTGSGWSSTDVFTIQYDNKQVRYYRNGTLARTTSAQAGQQMSAMGVIASLNGSFTILGYTAAGAAGSAGATSLPVQSITQPATYTYPSEVALEPGQSMNVRGTININPTSGSTTVRTQVGYRFNGGGYSYFTQKSATGSASEPNALAIDETITNNTGAAVVVTLQLIVTLASGSNRWNGSYWGA